MKYNQNVSNCPKKSNFFGRLFLARINPYGVFLFMHQKIKIIYKLRGKNKEKNDDDDPFRILQLKKTRQETDRGRRGEWGEQGLAQERRGGEGKPRH